MRNILQCSSGESLPLTNENSVGEDTCHAVRISRKNKLLKLPYNLTYDGISNWSPFKPKFQNYAEAYNWSEEDYLNCLCWAVDLYAVLIEQNELRTFRSLMLGLEKRFGIKELPKIAQVRFFKAAQKYDKSRTVRWCLLLEHFKNCPLVMQPSKACYVFVLGCMRQKSQCMFRRSAKRQWKKHWTLYNGITMSTAL